MRNRSRFALLAIIITVLPFAVGVLKNGLVEIILLSPVVWFLLADRSREAANRSLLLLISVCVTLSLCDLLLRPLIGDKLHYSPMNLYHRRLPALPLLSRWDPSVHYVGSVYGDLAAITGNPGHREPRSILFRTDARGFRNEKVPDRVELIILGDSFSAGVGVSQADDFGHVLARSLQKSVYNLSYPGGPYEQFLNFAIETPTLSLAPSTELVWTIYTGNDLDDSGGDVWELDKLPWREGFSSALVIYRTFRDRSPLRQGWEAIRARLKGISTDVIVRMLPDGRPVLFYGPQEAWGRRTRVEVERHPNFSKLLTTFRAMKKMAETMGVRVTIIILPTKGEVYGQVLNPQSPDVGLQRSGFGEAVLSACEQVSLVCWDSKPYLHEEARRLLAASQQLLWWRDDTHLNVLGQRALASFVSHVLHQDTNGERTQDR